ncbi:nucleotide sugar dehydrogenase [Candidatus Pelagibacter sp.]|uniref:nucleotide sugar dehydrogenase n=1 Tax=Candidatus Pelagibacter sp. TaxID=2024849 RepID=UPI003F879045
MSRINEIIGVVGLGYVGLPLAVELGKHFKVKGYDISQKRIEEIKKNKDSNNEIPKSEFVKSKKLLVFKDIKELVDCSVIIITTPTPIDFKNTPDLKMLKNSTIKVASILKKKKIVVYESTVYPGCTEEVCVPLLEKYSKLKYNKDFYCGYSPERINVGDKKHKLVNVKKIVSGSNQKTLNLLSKIYSKIIKAGIYKATSIKVAEAAKVIENVQRDLNIALMNEISIIFSKLKLNTKDVIDAAATKWNFHKYHPGLVGGHCIGVDPYYLTYKSKKVGYDPKVILSGRKINDLMYLEIISKIKNNHKYKKMRKKKKILILGLAFKENCNDIRNSKIFDVAKYFIKENNEVHAFDPKVSSNIFEDKMIIHNKIDKKNFFDIIIISVPHDEFIELGIKKIKKFGKKNSIIFDIKNTFNNKKLIDETL